jgi:hypothetical protein
VFVLVTLPSISAAIADNDVGALWLTSVLRARSFVALLGIDLLGGCIGRGASGD